MNAWLCTRNVATRTFLLCASPIPASLRCSLRVPCYAALPMACVDLGSCTRLFYTDLTIGNLAS